MRITIKCPHCGKDDRTQSMDGQVQFFTKCEHCGEAYSHDIQTRETVAYVRKKQVVSRSGIVVDVSREAAAKEEFAAYFRQNYPGPNTIIAKPDWHAPKIFGAALYAIMRHMVTPPADADETPPPEASRDTRRLDFMQDQARRGFVCFDLDPDSGELNFRLDPRRYGPDHAGRGANTIRQGIDDVMQGMEGPNLSDIKHPKQHARPDSPEQTRTEFAPEKTYATGGPVDPSRPYVVGEQPSEQAVRFFEKYSPEASVPLIDPIPVHAYAILQTPESQAAADVLAERARQVSVEGYVHDHDDEHDNYAMTRAAAAYLLHDFGVSALLSGSVPELHQPLWPWNHDEWNPKDRRRNLVRAAALILAEVERMDRGAING